MGGRANLESAILSGHRCAEAISTNLITIALVRANAQRSADSPDADDFLVHAMSPMFNTAYRPAELSPTRFTTANDARSPN